MGFAVGCSLLSSTAMAQSSSVFPPQGGSLPALSQQNTSASASGLRGVETSAAPTNGQNQTQPLTTGTVRAGTAAPEQPYEEDLNQPYDQSLDLGSEPLETQDPPRTPVDPTGVRVGSFMLRPSISQNIETERTRSNGSQRQRDYLSTAIRGTMTSDWSRHALTVTGEGVYERNIRGGQDGLRPEVNVNADLRLDLADDTIAHLTSGYSFTREDDYDPNAIGGATTQSGVSQYTMGASVQRELGRIRGLAAVNLTRSTYTDAELSNGTTVDRKDRNRTGVDGRLRLGYELSHALVPFIEVQSGRNIYDRTRDGAGYARSSNIYAIRSGIEFDMGEKLRGEIGTGYELVRYDDSRLNSVKGITFNGNAIWSPQRGTTVDMGLRTTVQDSTTPGQSGWVEYQLTAALAHEIRHNVVARLTSGATLRDFPRGQEDGTVWTAGAGLTWSINPYLDLTGNVAYEHADSGGSEDKIVRAGVGLTLRR